ncbi:hypothetical protein KAR91_63875 [Candidatus Pacearchaeota archaeon]|nr:hypothetical protein [Candidatus Pacearchaeota archaeon]
MSKVFEVKTTKDDYIERNPGMIKRHILSFKPGTYLNIRISKARKMISDPLRRYYFGYVVDAIAKEFYDSYLGRSSDALHEEFKRLFAPVPDIQPDSEIIWRFVKDKTPDKNGLIIIPSIFSNQSPVPNNIKEQYVQIVEHFAATKLNFSTPGFRNSEYGRK